MLQLLVALVGPSKCQGACSGNVEIMYEAGASPMSPPSPILPPLSLPAYPLLSSSQRHLPQLMRPDSYMQPKGHTSPWTWRRVCINQKSTNWIKGRARIRVHGWGRKQRTPGCFLLEKERMVSWLMGSLSGTSVTPGEAAGEISGATELRKCLGCCLGIYGLYHTEQSVEYRCWRWERILRQERGLLGIHQGVDSGETVFCFKRH